MYVFILLKFEFCTAGRSRERHVGQSISTPNEESNILKKENAHNNDTTISSNQSLGMCSYSK